MNKENIEEILKNLGVEEPTDKVRQIAQQTTNNFTENLSKQQPGQYNLLQFIIRSKITRFAAAAVLILAVSLFCFWPNPEPTIKTPPAVAIPPELAALTPEQLLQLYYNPSETAYDVNIVRVALQQSLKRTPAKKVIEIAKNFSVASNESKQISSDMVISLPPYHPVEHLGYTNKTFAEVVKESNLFVYARIAHIDINVDDIIAALINSDKRRLEDWEFLHRNEYRTNIRLEVIDALPKNTLKAEKSITVPAILNDKQLENIKEGSEYFVAMVKNAGKDPNFLENFSGVYPTDFNNPMMSQVWQFFADVQNVKLSGNKPKQETMDYWIAGLEGQNCELALEYMNVLPDELIPAGAIVSAIQSRYSSLMVTQNPPQPLTNDEATKLSNLRIFNRAANLIARAGDKECIKQMFPCLDAYLFNEENMKFKNLSYRIDIGQNLSDLRTGVIKLVITSAQDNPGQRLIETYFKYKDVYAFKDGLITEIIKHAGKIGDVSMLLEMLGRPSDFGLMDNSKIQQIWSILASSEQYDMRSGLEKFLVSLDLSDAGVNIKQLPNGSSAFSYERSAFEVLQSLPDSTRPSHKELLGWLMLIYQRNKNDRNCQYFLDDVMQKILEPQDTEFIPVLLELLNADININRIAKIISERMPDPSLAPYVRALLDKEIANNTNTNTNTISYCLKALYACGQQEEAINKALAILAIPLREDNPVNLYQDILRIADVICFLGQTKKDYLIPVIEGFTQKQSIDRYMKRFEDYGYRSHSRCLTTLQESANTALANLRSK